MLADCRTGGDAAPAWAWESERIGSAATPRALAPAAAQATSRYRSGRWITVGIDAPQSAREVPGRHQHLGVPRGVRVTPHGDEPRLARGRGATLAMRSA